ncbi:Flavoprotein involved in thiazole biosynthesis-like protein [Staphylothermus marinus F1]|uniref:Flavoprotein involved in thiazole biosynthesis-like protein n=1 Tax=Staphylothermus marinus (strain ATCC 43588 / DSM 3639 / JCM 9404 / F1) TaxID=399550 RepID=A3DKY3_STAMF|nr:flavoprotein involved in thiazole biosynthesis-like protein [Staphylothermus marinus]ABN69293.1 Flavoprotein involved in thiazole biosynthesis-like protein [Staphylothermus marinus F1]
MGAGYTGLYIASKLLENNHKVLVIESEPGLTHEKYYSGINGNKVRISKRFWHYVDDLGLNIIDEDEYGFWVRPLDVIVLLASKVISLGGEIIVDSIIEPTYKIMDDRIIIIGASVRSVEDEGGLDKFYILTRGIIDTSPSAIIVNNLIDRLKLGIPIQGAGPQIPGSDDVIGKTTWIFPGILVAGLAAIYTNAGYIPFPDIGPLFGSGYRAVELFVKGYPKNPEDFYSFPSII